MPSIKPELPKTGGFAFVHTKARPPAPKDVPFTQQDFTKVDPLSFDTEFEQALAFTFDQEGGYLSVSEAKRIGDKGGETKYGITKKTYPHLDIANLTRPEALEIYQRDFWFGPKFDKLPPTIGFIAFDFGVNSGPGWPIWALREAVGMPKKGLLTEEVLAKINRANEADLAENLLQRRGARLATLSRSEGPEVVRAWTRRIKQQAEVAGRKAHGRGLFSTSADKREVLGTVIVTPGPQE